METEVTQQTKQERSRTRWTASLDKVFADLVVKQIQLGNRPNNVFDKKTWNHIRDEFNKHTDLNFNNNQLRKHLDVLRTRFNSLKPAYDQNDFSLEDTCCIGFDLWEDIAAQTRPETVKVRGCPIYDQLCAIFEDTSADGKYAQSSHFEGLDKSVGTNTSATSLVPDGETQQPENPSSSRLEKANGSSCEKVMKSIAERKRKRCKDQEILEGMAGALSEMVVASKLRAGVMIQIDDRYSITNCIKALDEIETIDDWLYFASLDLFEDPNFRETFLSLKGEKIRLAWLQGKCGKAITATSS